jgi:hypothetical protein
LQEARGRNPQCSMEELLAGQAKSVLTTDKQ